MTVILLGSPEPRGDARRTGRAWYGNGTWVVGAALWVRRGSVSGSELVGQELEVGGEPPAVLRVPGDGEFVEDTVATGGNR
jgi:hypothetical protein